MSLIHTHDFIMKAKKRKKKTDKGMLRIKQENVCVCDREGKDRE
jgi:hypothetical protein